MIFKASISCAHLIYCICTWQLSIGLPNAEYGEEGVYRQGLRNATVVGRADICDCRSLPPSREKTGKKLRLVRGAADRCGSASPAPAPARLGRTKNSAGDLARAHTIKRNEKELRGQKREGKREGGIFAFFAATGHHFSTNLITRIAA